MTTKVSVILAYPDLLGTYGDGGNATILAQRLKWRGFPVDSVAVGSGQPLPTSGDFYVVGGGEDQPQARARELMAEQGRLAQAVAAGAGVLAICAGLQILGESFDDPEGRPQPGLGLLDCRTHHYEGRRAVGELLVEPGPALEGLGPLTGFENHQGRTDLGPAAKPLGTVLTGVGNGSGQVEGATTGRILGTYMHGPVLARNPQLADLFLSWVVGPLAPLDDERPLALYRERTAAARRD